MLRRILLYFMFRPCRGIISVCLYFCAGSEWCSRWLDCFAAVSSIFFFLAYPRASHYGHSAVSQGIGCCYWFTWSSESGGHVCMHMWLSRLFCIFYVDKVILKWYHITIKTNQQSFWKMYSIRRTWDMKENVLMNKKNGIAMLMLFLLLYVFFHVSCPPYRIQFSEILLSSFDSYMISF